MNTFNIYCADNGRGYVVKGRPDQYSQEDLRRICYGTTTFSSSEKSFNSIYQEIDGYVFKSGDLYIEREKK